MEDLTYADYDYEDVGEVEYADYYEDENYVDDAWQDGYGQEKEETAQPMSFEDLYSFCIIPTFSDSYKHLIGILSWSLLFLLSSRIIRLPSILVHCSSTLFGGALLWQMFEWRCNLMVGLFIITYLNLLSAHYVLKRWRGPSSFTIGVIYLVVCEVWLINPLWWHAIRGIQMVILMKLVSLGYDLDSGKLEAMPNIIAVTGYTFTPGTVIFGPWVPFSTYNEVITPMKWNLKWLLKLLVKTVASGFFLIFSTCFISWLIPDTSNRWILAFRDALSFRSSHYFVSFLSEVSSGLSGLDVEDVCRPFAIEAPRSLVEVVVHWNTAMHRWLKTYVFNPSRAKFGSLGAIILTYGMSALFHGINFQLSAVLFSLGFYTYTEYSLRKKISETFDACVMARPCDKCEHKNTAWSAFSLAVNLLFGTITVFHLCYLGMMFDSAHQMQEKGYSVVHTLRKWSALNYTSHWISLFMYILMAVL